MYAVWLLFFIAGVRKAIPTEGQWYILRTSPQRLKYGVRMFI